MFGGRELRGILELNFTGSYDLRNALRIVNFYIRFTAALVAKDHSWKMILSQQIGNLIQVGN